MKQKVTFVGMVLSAMSIMLALALSGFEYIATDADRYNRYQAELNVYQSVGVQREELELVQRDVASYLRGRYRLNNREVRMFGAMRPVFNERELSHMTDVGALFDLGRRVRLIALFFAMATGWLMVRRKKAEIAAALMCALCAWAGLGLVLAAACGFNFDIAFIQFHELLFTNDLWMLNPETDAMIRMYPEQFFVWMARDIGIAMAIGMLSPILISYISSGLIKLCGIKRKAK